MSFPWPHKLLLTAVAAAGLAVAVPAAAEPPAGGLFVPGESVAAVRLGMTPAQVLATWGERHGVCRACERTTWYFNERPFRPQGMGVAFERGRVAHAFTLWQPDGWTTPAGLELGAAGGEIGATYGELTERACAGYTALVESGRRAESVFYVYEDEVWGFGLMRRGANPCL